MLIQFLGDAIKALPTVATSPYALIGYVVTLAAWAFAMHRSVRLKVLMARLEQFPEADRARIVQLEMGEILPPHISAEQWIRARNHRHFLLAGITLLITLTVIGVVTINAGTEAAKDRADREIEAAKALERKAALQYKRQALKDRMRELDERYVAAQKEYLRGANGLKFAPPEEHQSALDIIKAASADGLKVIDAKKEVQKQLDELPLE